MNLKYSHKVELLESLFVDIASLFPWQQGKLLIHIVTKMYLLNTNLMTTMPFVTAHLEIFHCTHHSVIPKSDLYFTFCSTLNTFV